MIVECAIAIASIMFIIILGTFIIEYRKLKK